MPVQNQLPLSHSDQYSADSACGHCDGVIRHEPWCITQSPRVQYASCRDLDTSDAFKYRKRFTEGDSQKTIGGRTQKRKR